eukprot:IDg22002t1
MGDCSARNVVRPIFLGSCHHPLHDSVTLGVYNSAFSDFIFGMFILLLLLRVRNPAVAAFATALWMLFTMGKLDAGMMGSRFR